LVLLKIVNTNHIVLFSTYLVICSIIILLLLNLKSEKNFNIFSNIINNFIYNLLLFFFIIKFLITIQKVKNLSLLINYKLMDKAVMLNFNGSLFSDVIVILGLFTGIICYNLISGKSFVKNTINSFLFFFFFIATIFMVYTSNILIMFLSFEFLFLPTIYCVYFYGYSKKVDKSCKYLIFWTLLGSFIVLVSLGFLYNIYQTLNYNQLKLCKLNSHQLNLIYIVILFGFGIKIPVVPFQHWLLKVHVESPTPFSIFLSGFLVKSAVFCFYNLNLLLQNYNINLIIILWVSISLLVASFGLYSQTDFKKLIAWATVQEMTLILFFLIIKNNTININLYIFILLHGILSAYMFYTVDIIYRRFRTREILIIQGLSILMPNCIKYIWLLLIVFTGFPTTAKFLIEWDLVLSLLNTSYVYIIFLIFFINFIAVIGFCQILLNIMYGKPCKTTEILDLQRNEKILLNYLTSLMLILNLYLFNFI